jgi:hypothetical protein
MNDMTKMSLEKVEVPLYYWGVMKFWEKLQLISGEKSGRDEYIKFGLDL